MEKTNIQISAEFKSQATKAILALIFFAFSFVMILLFAGALTVLGIIAGFMIVAIKPMFLTIALGFGLVTFSVLMLIYQLKFIFASHKVDRSHMIEINKENEPELFNLINEIVQEVGTSYPKKVYLSNDVNAAVFYNSNFWSMIFPAKKNLEIGLGLVNSVTREELRAILSHEFGHFSQKSMKVGTYVYNVNKVIFNMLFDNESYEMLIRRWADSSWIFSIFVVPAVKINSITQWVLKKLYEVVNKSYMGLSREMEFHADVIAASVTGSKPLKSSLLRMSLAEHSFNNVLSFYHRKISAYLRSENIYRDHKAVINYLAEINNIPIKNELPDISKEELIKFDKSKLVIKDQWASHPTTTERIERLEKTNFASHSQHDTLANNLFKNIEETQKRLTDKLFETVSYQGDPEYLSFDDFQKEYKNEIQTSLLPKIYNGYYDHKNPTKFELNNSHTSDLKIEFNDLFSDYKVDSVYTAISLQNDLEVITSISDNSIQIRTFDYDGVRYDRKDAKELIKRLKIALEELNELIKQNDRNIYLYFSNLENKQNRPNDLESLYKDFFEFDKDFVFKYDIYQKLSNELHFVNITTPFEQITANFAKIKPLEESLKSEISKILTDNLYQTEITEEIKQSFELYISKTRKYFSGTDYYSENLNILFTALSNYAYLLSKGYILMKKRILNYQEELLKTNK